MSQTSALLRRLSEACGVSGYEGEARDLAREMLAPYAHEVHVDILNNVIALRRGERPPGAHPHSIMLAAHVDEIGLMVSGVEGTYLRFERVGGVDRRTVVGQEVIVHGRRPLPGIIASHPPHVQSEADREKPYPLADLFIDVGLSEESLRDRVRIGDLVTMRREYVELAEGYASGKAFDDRAGVVAMVLCLEALVTMRHTWDVYAVATSQEEIGLRGATVSGYSTAPDVAIAIDVGFGSQQGLAENESIAMDGGPAIAIGPNIHPKLRERLVAVAGQHELKVQSEVAAGATGTDAWAFQVAREGIPTALLSLPLRYMHTSVETVCLRDIERAARLMALTIAGLDDEFATQMGI